MCGWYFDLKTEKCEWPYTYQEKINNTKLILFYKLLKKNYLQKNYLQITKFHTLSLY